LHFEWWATESGEAKFWETANNTEVFGLFLVCERLVCEVFDSFVFVMATATETVPTPTPATEEDTNAASKKDEIKNEYISILNKKLRSIAKKAARLTDIEKKVEQGAQINDEQQSILANKDNINKSLKDYEDLRAQFMKVHQQVIDTQLRSY
jgi:hypothetical protein